MRNTNQSIGMVGIFCTLAGAACGQAVDNLSSDSLSSELGHRRGAAAGAAALQSPRTEAAEDVSHTRGDRERDCDAGAAEGGGDDDRATPPDSDQAARWSGDEGGRGGQDRRKKKRRRGGGGAGGTVAEMPGSGGGGAPAPEEPTEPSEPGGGGTGGDQPGMEDPGSGEPDPGTPSGMFRPAPGMSWQIQLTGDIDTSVNAEVFDLDLFETSAADIAQLHGEGRKVICYFDTAYESYRPDSSQLEPYRGNPIKGWPGQYWIDIREPAVMEVMKARIALAESKGCDAVDADDVDSRSNNPGFPISAADQRSFVTQLSAAAHGHGLSFGLKNALEDLASLMDVVDFSVNEECFQYDECEPLTPMVEAGKAVFQIEYASGSLQSRADQVCAQANALGFDTIIKRLDLDAARLSCR